MVLARRTGDTWHVSGINGTGQAMEKELALPFIGSGEAVLVTDGPEPRSFRREAIRLTSGKTVSVSMKRNGGFLLKGRGTSTTGAS